MPQNTPTVIHDDITNSLPGMLSAAITSYELFMDAHTPDPKEANEFEAHHKACKTAAAHIELLLKMMKLAQAILPEAAADDDPKARISELLQQGQSSIEEDIRMHPIDTN